MVLRPVPAAQDSDQPLPLICLPGDPLLVPYNVGRPVPAAWVFRILLLLILPLLVPYNVARLVPAAQLLRESHTVELLMILPILVYLCLVLEIVTVLLIDGQLLTVALVEKIGQFDLLDLPV